MHVAGPPGIEECPKALRRFWDGIGRGDTARVEAEGLGLLRKPAFQVRPGADQKSRSA
jgi:hypothetical protein